MHVVPKTTTVATSRFRLFDLLPWTYLCAKHEGRVDIGRAQPHRIRTSFELMSEQIAYHQTHCHRASEKAN